MKIICCAFLIFFAIVVIASIIGGICEIVNSPKDRPQKVNDVNPFDFDV